MTNRKDSVYTSGVIAVRETRLLKDKIVKFCSMSAEEAFRSLLDSGFGGGEAESVHEIEQLVLSDERDVDAFIREYSPSDDELIYLLAPRDFHNAKAIVKALHLKTDAAPMLGSEGNFSVETLKKKIEGEDYGALGAELGDAVKQARTLLEEGANGAQIGAVFENALSRYLDRALKKRGVCKRLHVRYVDMTNLLTAFRSDSAKSAEEFYLPCGSLSATALAAVFGESESVKKAFERSPYFSFVKTLLAARDRGEAYTEAEKKLASYELSYFSEKPYELSGEGTFLYYVLRRRAENENVRIVFVCLNAGLKEREIIRRLRGV